MGCSLCAGWSAESAQTTFPPLQLNSRYQIRPVFTHRTALFARLTTEKGMSVDAICRNVVVYQGGKGS